MLHTSNSLKILSDLFVYAWKSQLPYQDIEYKWWQMLLSSAHSLILFIDFPRPVDDFHGIVTNNTTGIQHTNVCCLSLSTFTHPSFIQWQRIYCEKGRGSDNHCMITLNTCCQRSVMNSLVCHSNQISNTVVFFCKFTCSNGHNKEVEPFIFNSIWKLCCVR